MPNREPTVDEPQFFEGEIEDLGTLLDLERLDDDLFRGFHARHGDPRRTLYGGQVAAQALRAAAGTVSDERLPHSLHGYFLRPGRGDRPILFHVERDRDGRSFSARHVSAKQNGKVIFSMLASFHVDEHSASFEMPPTREAPAPEDVEPGGWDGLVEMRQVDPVAVPPGQVSDLIWARVPGRLADDRLIHACALTYISDYGSGFSRVDVPDLALGGPSIDHMLWFHEPIRADEWVLLDMHPTRARGARGSYLGSMRDRDGRLGAVFGQEMLLRPH